MKHQCALWLVMTVFATVLLSGVPSMAQRQQQNKLVSPSGGPTAPNLAASSNNRNSVVGYANAADAPSSPIGRKRLVGYPPDPGTGNCYPFGCAYNGEYQQVYTWSLFKSPMTIVGLQFFNTAYDSGATTMNDGTWTISLSTTSADWDTLSTTFSSNIGSDNTQVFSGNLDQPWAFGYTLNIPLATPFTYDPSQGNLLMEVVASASAPHGNIFFDTNGYNSGGLNGNTIFGRVYCVSGTNCVPGNITVNSGFGLVTSFVVRPVRGQ